MDNSVGRTLFIGGLPAHSTEAEVRAYVGSFGQIQQGLLGQSKPIKIFKGYARVVMQTSDDARRVAAYENHVIGGCRVGISIWLSKDCYNEHKLAAVQPKVYVRFDQPVSEAAVRSHFGRFGVITRVTFKVNIYKSKIIRFCYISFQDTDQAQAAVAHAGHVVDGVQLICEMCRKIDEQYPKFEAASQPDFGWYATGQPQTSTNPGRTQEHPGPAGRYPNARAPAGGSIQIGGTNIAGPDARFGEARPISNRNSIIPNAFKAATSRLMTTDCIGPDSALPLADCSRHRFKPTSSRYDALSRRNIVRGHLSAGNVIFRTSGV